MRILIKGGVWKNTEDEILKAAVMKYGKNQWARVASLLNRKSGKQCKARWYEWLDPSIKKTEWSKEEEEKLLHLAKLMPNQWRTIAPIVGRTAAQCMEQYERLLDQVNDENITDGTSAGGSADTRKLRSGEIDSAPETKPARPDPIDMDEDEKEMLSEARARLANTKGKKAKRKARERQLEESRRLSMLQKRRELKAAGIDMKLNQITGKGKRKFIDYAREIPFQMVPPAGFYDVGEENERGKQMKFDPVTHGMELAKLDGKAQRDEELKQKAKDDKKLKALFKANAPLAVLTMANHNDPTSLRRRSALALPTPQVSDAELEDIVKVGQRSLMPPPEGTISATQSLIGNYSSAGYRPDQTPSTIQRTPLREDTIMQEARNQKIMRGMTPFLAAEAEDSELPELAEGTGFDGVTPRASRLATPNVVLQKSVPGTPLPNGMNSTASTTGSMTSSVRSNQTPLRDQFGLNSSKANRSNLTKGLMSGTPLTRVGDRGGAGYDDDSFSISETDSVTSTRMSEKQRVKHQRALLAAKLGNLPEPEYTYEVVIPEVENEDDIDQKNQQAEDTSDIQMKLKKARELNEQKELLRRSQVIQRQLPRPSSVNYNLAKSFYDTSENTNISTEIVNASSLIGQEMVQLLASDDYKYVNPTEKRKVRPVPVELDDIDDHYLHLAKKIIVEEYKSNPEYPHENIDLVELGLKAEEISKQHIFIPSTTGGGKYITTNEASKQELLTALANQHAAIKAKIQKDMKKSSKLENKISIMTQGYSLIADKLKSSYQASYDNYYKTATELECLEEMYQSEHRALQRRMNSAKEYLTSCEESEKLLQARYAALREEYESLVK